jgi:predicted alpha/beta-fold hydrolase
MNLSLLQLTEWGGHLGFMDDMDGLLNPNREQLLESVATEAVWHHWEESGSGPRDWLKSKGI